MEDRATNGVPGGPINVKPIVDQLRKLRNDILVEVRVFHRLGQTVRDDNAASLYNISLELARLEILLAEALEGLGP